MQLLKSQKQAIDKLKQWKVGALFMRPGTGKTKTAYELIKTIDCNLIIWLTPFQTKDNLLFEINLYGGLNNLEIVGIETLSNSDKTYNDLLNKIKKSKVFLIVDESLKIKNWEAIRTKRILELSKYCDYKLILNGTPITRNLLDIWSQVEFLSPKILNMSLAEFKSTFCETVKITKKYNGKHLPAKEVIKNYHNVDYLYSLLNNYVYECDLELDIVQNYKNVDYVLSDDEIELYNDFKAKYLDNEILKMMNNNIFIEMTQKMQHSYCCSENKFTEFDNLLKKLELDQTIVYTKFIKSYEQLKKRYPALNILTYGKHAIGLNLQQFSNTIYFDKTFDYSQMVQSEYRTFRTGQNNDCIYYSLTGNVGLENMINENIYKKQSLLEYFKQVGINQIKNQL